MESVMWSRNVPVILGCALLSFGVVIAQDAMRVDPAHYTLIVENATVRVLKISYGPGEKSTMHQHPDSIVIPLTASKVRFTLPDGTAQDADMASESGTYSPAGSHNPANVGTGRTDAVLVEFKGTAPGTAVLPAARPGLAMTVLAEGPRGMAYRTTAAPAFQEPAGTTHDYDQVVIALGPTKMSLTLDGKPARTSWARGDVELIGRGVRHESRNIGGAPADFIIVAIK
jgi:quercetin dioxygenase-like cupin family protein